MMPLGDLDAYRRIVDNFPDDGSGEYHGIITVCTHLINEIERLTSPRHGVARYDNHGCRCDICRAAKAEGMRAWRRRNKERRLPVVLDAAPTYVSLNQAKP